MRLATFEGQGRERIGLVIDDQLLDLATAWEYMGKGVEFPAGDMKALLAHEQGLENVRIIEDAAKGGAVWLEHVSQPVAGARLLAPILRPEKIVCIGLNYRDHAEESNMPLPKEPVIFGKFANAVIGPEDNILLPTSLSDKVDFEAELAVVIGRRATWVSEKTAMNYVAGYMNFNDVSARDLQKRDGQWFKGKCLDTFAPMGPWLVTKDEIPDPENLKIELRLNGETMQSSNTMNLIFGIAYLVSFLSRLMTLEPGDIIATGTPAGVGFAHKPPVFLRTGDTVEVEIEGLGILRNGVAAR